MAAAKSFAANMLLFSALVLFVFQDGCRDKSSSTKGAAQQLDRGGEKPAKEKEEQESDTVEAPPGADTGEVVQQTVEAAEQPPSGKRVVLIVVDTLRADRVGCYGYRDFPTTPAIDRLAEQGILFERFYAASPWTAPSFGSFLTGMPPTIHKAGYRLASGAKGTQRIKGVNVTPLSREVPTLGEMLGKTTSAAIVTNSFLHPGMGFDRGFDRYDFQNGGISKSRRADETTKAATEWLKRHKSQSFFLMVHYFDPHMGYDPPKKYVPVFAPGPSGRVSRPFLEHSAARTGRFKPTAEEKAFIVGLYNGEVRFVDDQVGALVGEMDRLGMLEDTWIAVTADHGEEQFDHGSFDHGHRYEDEVMRIPLVVRPPGGKWRAGARIPYSARHIDLTPTILEWMSTAAPGKMAGRSLTPLMSGAEKANRPAYMEFNLYWKQQRALYDGRYKLIEDVIGSRRYLYDLEEDPLEKKASFGKTPMLMALQAEAIAIRKGIFQLSTAFKVDSAAAKLPADVQEALRSLGYVK